jgi:hypothetical protein
MSGSLSSFFSGSVPSAVTTPSSSSSSTPAWWNDFLQTTVADAPDPIAALVRLRAKVLHLANDVQGLADEASIREVRVRAPLLRDKLVNLIMETEIVEACNRGR